MSLRNEWKRLQDRKPVNQNDCAQVCKKVCEFRVLSSYGHWRGIAGHRVLIPLYLSLSRNSRCWCKEGWRRCINERIEKRCALDIGFTKCPQLKVTTAIYVVVETVRMVNTQGGRAPPSHVLLLNYLNALITYSIGSNNIFFFFL